MAWWRRSPSEGPDGDREDEVPSPVARSRPKDWPEGLPWDGSVADHVPGTGVETDRSGPGSDPEPEPEPEEPEPELHPRQHWALIGTVVGLWVVVMAVLGVHWWDFERHGPWLTPLTPIAFAGALEGALIARRPELDRHHDPDEPLRRRRRAHELGDRARPYWAREGYDATQQEGVGGAGAAGEETATGGAATSGRATAIGASSPEDATAARRDA